MRKELMLPHAGIVLLIGPSNSGKTTFLKKCVDRGILNASEIVSSDQFRLLVADQEFIEWSNRPKDEADVLFEEYKLISKQAFDAMDSMVIKRSQLGRLTIIDATHLHSEDRKKYIEMAKQHHIPSVAIVFDIPQDILLDRDEKRDFPRGKKRVKQQVQIFDKYKRLIQKEGFSFHYLLKQDEIGETALVRKNNPIEQDVGAGLDFIGDVHACFDEFLELLNQLGYSANEEGLYFHPEGRRFVSVGDVMSRGPRSLDCMIFFKRHVEADLGFMIDSNHGWKIARWLDGRNVTLSHGDEKIVVKAAIDSVSHYTLPIEELIYIPPTMSPTPEPSKHPDYLEHPQEAFNYYRSNGIKTMVVEKKHSVKVHLIKSP